jgi:DNA repair protein RadD
MNAMLQPAIQDWYFQADAVQSVFDYFVKDQGNPLVVMPTGTGKSVVIAKLIARILREYPRQRLLCFTHVKELIKQNSDKLRAVWPAAPYGILSAGLKQRDTSLPVIFGGIQTGINYIEKIGWRDLMLVDECHLVSPKARTRYQEFIAGMRRINPNFKVIGLSATPWRVGLGHLTQGDIFTDVCYDISTFDWFLRLIDEGYLAPLIPKKTQHELDYSNVKIGQDGDYAKNELQTAVDTHDTNHKVCAEMCEMADARDHWLVFASGVKHAQHVAETLNGMGISSLAVYDKMGDAARDYALDSFRGGDTRCLVNNNILTTGHDFPFLDYIGMLRPTNSPGLWVQMLGRGTRPYPGKENCLVGDFCGNTRRLGPINDPVIPRPKGQTTTDPPIKLCPRCGMYNHSSSRVCGDCGYEFPSSGSNAFLMLNPTADDAPLIAMREQPVYEWFDVARVLYSRHKKEGAPDCLKASYVCGLRVFHEYVHFEHAGFAKHKAHEWWRQRTLTSAFEPPATVDEVMAREREMYVPGRIQIWINRKYPEIVKYENFRTTVPPINQHWKSIMEHMPAFYNFEGEKK